MNGGIKEAIRVSTVYYSKSVDRISDVEIGIACRVSTPVAYTISRFLIYVISYGHNTSRQQHVTMS